MDETTTNGQGAVVSAEAPTSPRTANASPGGPAPVTEQPAVPGAEDAAEAAAEGPEIPPEFWEAAYPPKAPLPNGGFRARPPEKVRLLEMGHARDEGGHLNADVRERLLLLDTWQRSGLSSNDFGKLVGISKTTLMKWRRAFEASGPAGLVPGPVGQPQGSRLDEATKRAVLMMKTQHPEWGVERLHLMLLRGPGLFASAGAIANLLKENGYVAEEVPTKPHPDKPRSFERARPNQLWQSDLFTFTLKRQNRRVYLVAYMDDHSRFIVGQGLYASSSGALTREVLETAIVNFGAPEEVLTDRGPQYYTWRGKSDLTKLLDRRGIRHLVSRAHHPQTLGKIERFWGTLWREGIEHAVFQDLDDARRRIGHFVDYYNFQRPHEGIDGAVPADRFFSAAAEVKAALRARVAANALDLAQHGVPRKAFYLTGRVGDEAITVHAEGERVVLTKEDGTREEVDLTVSGRRAHPGADAQMPEPVSRDGSPPDIQRLPGEGDLPAPGTSVLDEVIGPVVGDGAKADGTPEGGAA